MQFSASFSDVSFNYKIKIEKYTHLHKQTNNTHSQEFRTLAQTHNETQIKRPCLLKLWNARMVWID